jgi:hypothetical protein
LGEAGTAFYAYFSELHVFEVSKDKNLCILGQFSEGDDLFFGMEGRYGA